MLRLRGEEDTRRETRGGRETRGEKEDARATGEETRGEKEDTRRDETRGEMRHAAR